MVIFGYDTNTAWLIQGWVPGFMDLGWHLMATWESVSHCDPTVPAAGVLRPGYCGADYHKLLETWCAGAEMVRWLSLDVTPIQLGLSKAGPPGFLDLAGLAPHGCLGVSFAL